MSGYSPSPIDPFAPPPGTPPPVPPPPPRRTIAVPVPTVPRPSPNTLFMLAMVCVIAWLLWGKSQHHDAPPAPNPGPAPADRITPAAAAYRSVLASSFSDQAPRVEKGEVASIADLVAEVEKARASSRADFAAAFDEAIKATADDNGKILDRQAAAKLLRRTASALGGD